MKAVDKTIDDFYKRLLETSNRKEDRMRFLKGFKDALSICFIGDEYSPSKLLSEDKISSLSEDKQRELRRVRDFWLGVQKDENKNNFKNKEE